MSNVNPPLWFTPSQRSLIRLTAQITYVRERVLEQECRVIANSFENPEAAVREYLTCIMSASYLPSPEDDGSDRRPEAS
ncbi:MAG: hypothetical protein R3360_01080 [Alphaproteobacteria bacterium]|nr:hypothetical protein [Alphaproteobacteria bacterium]